MLSNHAAFIRIKTFCAFACVSLCCLTAVLVCLRVRCDIVGISFIGYCWFASDVTAAMLVVKNKSISLRWEMNSILMQI